MTRFAIQENLDRQVVEMPVIAGAGWTTATAFVFAIIEELMGRRR